MHNVVTKSSDRKHETLENTETRPIIGGTINNETPECFFCGTTNNNGIKLELCKYCNDIYYCGPTHFEYHRGSESRCYPYIIKHAPGVGR